MPTASERIYDVALSFAGEDREYVEQVASNLRESGVKVFYDKHEEVSLWGKDLYTHFDDIYRNQARYMVMFVSEHYARKVWSNHERRSAQARALQEKQEYILPARFDDTEIPGLRETLGYVDLRHKTPEQLSNLICDKLIQGGAELRRRQSPAHGSSVTSARPDAATHISVRVADDAGHPIRGAQIFLIAANGTHQEGKTDHQGQAKLPVPKRRLLTVYCAHEAFPAHIERDFDPVRNLQIMIPKVEKMGSIIFPNGSGYIPGLVGRLNPILDTSNRTYLYAENIAIEGGEQQPATFKLGSPFIVEDKNGRVFNLRIVEIINRLSLIEFTER